MRTLAERRHLSVTHLVQDPTRIFVAEVVDATALAHAQLAQCRGREFGIERQRLQAREHAVATEHGHEPRQSGRGQAPAAGAVRRESQCRKIDQAALVRPFEIAGFRVQLGRGFDPTIEITLHVRLRPPARLRRTSQNGKTHGHGDGRRPYAVCRDPDRERKTVGVVFRRAVGRDGGEASVGVAGVFERQLGSLDASRRLSLLPQGVLHLEEVGEVTPCVDANRELDRRVVVIHHRELFVEAGADRAVPDHRQLRVDVNRAGPGHEEELALEVLDVVDRQGVEAIAVDAQYPLRQEARVEREEARRIRQRGFDVAALVAHDEGVAVEDLHQVIGHCPAPFRLGCPAVDRAVARRGWSGHDALEREE